MIIKSVRIDTLIDNEKHFRNRMYIFIENESRGENLVNRFSRPHQMYKKEIIPLVMKNLKKNHIEYYNKLKDQKWSWSQRCGCTCGCSPGFIGSGKERLSIYVDVDFNKKQKK